MLADLRRRNMPTADLARVLALWLVVILLVQGWAALHTLVRGPAHRHVPAQLHAQEQTQTRTSGQAHGFAHQRAHELGQAHHHAAGVVVLPADALAALDAGACALMALLAPLATAAARAQDPGPVGPAPVAGAGWALVERSFPPPRRPPRG